MITQTEISTVHTIFNVGTTILLFPFSDLIIKLARKLEKEDENTEDESRVLLDDRMLETPGIALQSALSEVSRMGSIVLRTVDKAIDVIFTKDYQKILEIKEEEDTVDRLCSGITNYVVKLSSLSLNEKEHHEVACILQTLSDIERISDYCENISEFAETLTERKAVFTDVGRAELKEMAEVCAESFRYALEAFVENDKEKAMKVIEKESQADDLEIKLRTGHMQRLANNQCNTDAGIVYLDALVALERISDHSRNIAEEVLTA